ncbi:SEA (Seh1-associated) complex subunit [Parahypoxylon ruwenzoriense]
MYNQHRIVRRLLGRQNTESSTDGHIGVTSSPLPHTYRPNASQDAVYPSSAPVACLDRSPDGQTAVLGGRHILKTIHFDGLHIKEGVDVRSIITAHLANKSNATSLTSDQLSIKDVRLASNHENDLTIFTACANGKIFMYDINRLASGSGLEFIQTREDSRQVNKLDVNPHKGTWLLSGGQDGTVRCFDVKTPIPGRSGPTFRTFQAFRCNADGVSDVKWSPKDGMIFACAADSGVVLKWDIRKATAPLLKINAHDTQKGASSISWHADGDHLISAGLDSKCYVWDLSKNAEKRQKPKWTINAPAPVTSVSWRPGLWSATAQGRRAAQVAVSYDEGGHIKKYGISSVHIWDLARPTMPYKEIDVFENSPSALLWHDQDLLWTAGPDGFAQCDVAFAPKVMDRRPLSSLEFSARGDALMFLEERIQLPRPRPTIITPQGLPTSSYSSSPTGQMLSISRSDSEEDVIGSFLGTRRRTADKRRAGNRTTQPLSTTPPSSTSVEDKVIPLDQVMKLTGQFKSQQVMAIGQIPAAPKMDMYRHLSRQYLEILERDLPYAEGASPLNERVAGIIERYARASESVSQFRLAQTWRILSYAVGLLLSRRSQYHLELRLTRREKPIISIDEGVFDDKLIFSKENASPLLKVNGDDTPKKPSSVTSLEVRHPPGKSLLAEEIVSESNVPTPIARPVREDAADYRENTDGRKLTPVQEMESINLPPAILPENTSPRKRLDSTPLSTFSQDSQRSSTEGYDFYDLEEAAEALTKAIDVPQRREPPTLDYMEPGNLNRRRKPMARHDSDESSTQMFSLSETSRQASALTGSSNGSTRPIFRRAERYSQDSEDAEYGSRIRGKLIGESPENTRFPIRPPLERQGSSALTDDLKISQTISDTLGSDSFQQDDHLSQKYTVQRSVLLAERPREQISMGQPEDHLSPHITETDFLPWNDDPPYPHPIAADANKKSFIPPINPYDVLMRALSFESKRSALNASAMILLLKPLVPEGVMDSYQAAAILRQYHSRLMSMKLFVEAALLRNLCVRGWPDGLEIWGENYTSVFAPAQDRVSAGFVCARCHKPREIDRSNTRGPGIWKCERCRTVIAPCAVCGHRDATVDPLPPMPVSEGVTTASRPSDEPMLSTWWYCPGCSHGGHANCLQNWHAPIPPTRQHKEGPVLVSPAFQDDSFPETNSDGCCPFDGCGHACLPGRWRNESNTARTEELGRVVREQTRSGISVAGLRKAAKERKVGSGSSANASVASTPSSTIRGDVIEVPQSKAVESVREALSAAELGSGVSGGSGGSSNGGGGGLLGILSSSPGRAAVNMVVGSGPERRKSVKFAGPAAGDRR